MTWQKILANFLINDLRGLLRKRGFTLAGCPVAPAALGYLARLVHEGRLPKRKMRELVERWLDEPAPAARYRNEA